LEGSRRGFLEGGVGVVKFGSISRGGKIWCSVGLGWVSVRKQRVSGRRISRSISSNNLHIEAIDVIFMRQTVGCSWFSLEVECPPPNQLVHSWGSSDWDSVIEGAKTARRIKLKSSVS
jgi:hypothetical protein